MQQIRPAIQQRPKAILVTREKNQWVPAVTPKRQDRFYICEQCNQAVDTYDWSQVSYHMVPDHQPELRN